MKSEYQIKRLAKKIRVKPDAAVDERVLACAEAVLAKSTKNQDVVPLRRPSIWRTIMKSPVTKIAAVAVIFIAVLISIHHFGSSNSVFAAMIENAEQMPWIHMVSLKNLGSGEHRFEVWVSPRSKIIAKKWDGTLTFVNGIEEREYLYDSSQDKIFVSHGDFSHSSYESPTKLLRDFVHRLEAHAVELSSENKIIDGVNTEMITGIIPEGSQSVNVTLFRDIDNDLLTRLEAIFPDPSKNILAVYDYPETGPMSIYDLGFSSETEIVYLTAPPKLQELREKINSLRNANVKSYVAISIPCDVTKLPTSFRGEHDAVASIWRKNNSWRCDWGYYAEDSMLMLETLSNSVQHAAKSLIPAASHIVKGDKTYTLIRKEWGDGKLYKRSATWYPGNMSIERLCWPRMSGTVGVPVKWKVETVTGPNGGSLILIERAQDGRVPNDKGTYVMPTRDRWFFNPERNYICQKHEKSILLFADWVTNKQWLSGQENPRFEWAGRDYENIIEVLEYAQTSSGRWYPRLVEETNLWYNDEGSKAIVDQKSSFSVRRKVYLEENPDFPKEIFDPSNLSK